MIEEPQTLSLGSTILINWKGQVHVRRSLKTKISWLPAHGFGGLLLQVLPEESVTFEIFAYLLLL